MRQEFISSEKVWPPPSPQKSIWPQTYYDPHNFELQIEHPTILLPAPFLHLIPQNVDIFLEGGEGEESIKNFSFKKKL